MAAEGIEQISAFLNQMNNNIVKIHKIFQEDWRKNNYLIMLTKNKNILLFGLTNLIYLHLNIVAGEMCLMMDNTKKNETYT